MVGTDGVNTGNPHADAVHTAVALPTPLKVFLHR